MLMTEYGLHTLAIDEAAEIARITATITRYTSAHERGGVVVGLTGGIDSAVTAALCVRALGAEKVFGLHLPEGTSDTSLDFSTQLAEALGIDSVVEDISLLLRAAGAYRRRDDAIRTVVADYDDGWRARIMVPPGAGAEAYSRSSVLVQTPEGATSSHRLPAEVYLEIMAATGLRQRARKMLEYFHADRLDYVVAGALNRLGYDQGRFVKLGDGSADVTPIAHLYKSQVYALAEHLGIPQEIRERPSNDTYPVPQPRGELHLPYQRMDLCLYALDNGISYEAVASATGLSLDEVARVFSEIEQRRRTAAYLHAEPALVDVAGGSA